MRPIATIVGAYAAIAAAWIILSDRLLGGLGASATAQTVKGLLFVAVTAGVLALTMRREFDRQAELEEKLRRRPGPDPLTGLANRAAFDDRLDSSLARAGRYAVHLMVIRIDLDGQLDAVAAAERLPQMLRRSDLVAHLGEGRLCLLLEGIAGLADATAVANKLAAGIEGAGAIGLALFPLHAGEAHGLMRAAEDALEAAKRAGGGSWRLAA